MQASWHQATVIPFLPVCVCAWYAESQSRGRKSMAILQRIVVLLEPEAPEQGAFAEALHWAKRLQLPLHGIEFSPRLPGEHCPGRFPPPDRSVVSPEAALDERTEGLAQRYAAACARLGVPWEQCAEACHSPTGLPALFAANDLLVLEQSSTSRHRRELLQQLLRQRTPALLLCSHTEERPLRRMLILHEASARRKSVLPAALALCQRLGVTPVVLTVARSERRACIQEEGARRLVAGIGLPCEFDFVVGAEVRVAVACVARWRRCQVVAMDRNHSTSWWRWWRDDRFNLVTSLPAPLAALALPEGAERDSTPVVDSSPAARLSTGDSAVDSLDRLDNTIAAHPANVSRS